MSACALAALVPARFSVADVIADTRHTCLRIESASGERRFAKLLSDPAMCELEWKILSLLHRDTSRRRFQVPEPCERFLAGDGGCLILEFVQGVTARELFLHGAADARALCARIVVATAEIHELMSRAHDEVFPGMPSETVDGAVRYAQERLLGLIESEGGGILSEAEAHEVRQLAAPLFDILASRTADVPLDYYKDANPANWLVTDGGAELYAVDFESRRQLPFLVDFINIVEYAATYVDEAARSELLQLYVATRSQLSPQWSSAVDRRSLTLLLHLWAVFRHEEQMLHRVRDACTGKSGWHVAAFRYHWTMARGHLQEACRAGDLGREDSERLEALLIRQLSLLDAAFRRRFERPVPPLTIPSHFDAVTLRPGGPQSVRIATSDVWEQDSLGMRILIAGVCLSDIREIAGTRSIRRDFGHELVAVVAGSQDASPVAAGTLVCLDPHVALRRTSGFGEWMIASGPTAALQRALVVLPPNVPRRRILFTEPTACVYHCVMNIRAHLQRDTIDGLKIAVMGSGTAGVLIASIAQLLGGHVAVFNQSLERLSFLRERDILRDEQLLDLSRLISDSWDVVVCATARLTPRILTIAASAVRDGGLVLLYGGTRPGDVFGDLDCDSTRRGELLRLTRQGDKAMLAAGSYGAAPSDFVQAIRLLSRQEFAPVERLIARSVTLGDLPELLRAYATEERPHIGKTVVEFPCLAG